MCTTSAHGARDKAVRERVGSEAEDAHIEEIAAVVDAVVALGLATAGADLGQREHLVIGQAVAVDVGGAVAVGQVERGVIEGRLLAGHASVGEREHERHQRGALARAEAQRVDIRIEVAAAAAALTERARAGGVVAVRPAPPTPGSSLLGRTPIL